MASSVLVASTAVFSSSSSAVAGEARDGFTTFNGGVVVVLSPFLCDCLGMVAQKNFQISEV